MSEGARCNCECSKLSNTYLSLFSSKILATKKKTVNVAVNGG